MRVLTFPTTFPTTIPTMFFTTNLPRIGTKVKKMIENKTAKLMTYDKQATRNSYVNLVMKD